MLSGGSVYPRAPSTGTPATTQLTDQDYRDARSVASARVSDAAYAKSATIRETPLLRVPGVVTTTQLELFLYEHRLRPRNFQLFFLDCICSADRVALFLYRVF